MIPIAMPVIEILDRPTYGMSQVDRILALRSGTARRWIDGYTRAGVRYPPVVRVESTDDELVTWGEFVETRLLAEYRDNGVPMLRMRPAVERLREEFGTKYPLAHAKPYVDVDGRELVLTVQDAVGLDAGLRLVVVRSGQVILTPRADHFRRSAEFNSDGHGEVLRLHPFPDDTEVVIDPLRRFGEPVVRAVPTEVIAEQFERGDPIEMIAELFELAPAQIQAAIRYELSRGGSSGKTAA